MRLLPLVFSKITFLNITWLPKAQIIEGSENGFYKISAEASNQKMHLSSFIPLPRGQELKHGKTPVAKGMSARVNIQKGKRG